MLGFWNKAVYITYLGALFAVIGYMLFLKTGMPSYAFAGMFIAAVCDMFDGKVARKETNRSEQAKNFGVEIDSLSDIVCFIAVPALTIYNLGVDHWYQIIILSLYIVCGIVRLAYFNVAMSDKDKAIKEYRGLPVPVSVFIFGLVWILYKLIGFEKSLLIYLYTVIVPLVGILHISKIRIKKFTGLSFYITISIISLILIVVLFII